MPWYNSDSDSSSGSDSESEETAPAPAPAPAKKLPPEPTDEIEEEDEGPPPVVLNCELFSGVRVLRREFVPGDTLQTVREHIAKSWPGARGSRNVRLFFGKERIHGCPSPSCLADHGFVPGTYTLTVGTTAKY